MKNLKKTMSILLMLLLVVSIAIPTIQTEAASIKLNKEETSIYVGATTKLKLKGTKKTVKWTSSKKSVATVDSKGKVTAKKKGTVTITAKVGNKKYKCNVTVKNPTLNYSNVSLNKGKSFTLKLTGSKAKSWSTSNKKIVTVSKKGKITAKKSGTATITVTAENGKKYKAKVTVESPKINKTNITLNLGNTEKLSISGTKQKVTWESLNINVATVNTSGLITAISEGTT